MVRFLAIVLSLLISPGAWAADEGELLEPEQAFRFSARVADPQTLEVVYTVAPGYYLYRDKYRFALESAAVKLGKPRIPAGKVKEDEFFGRVEIQTGTVTLRLPLEKRPAEALKVTLKATSQGCAEAGVCYPPVESRAVLSLPALAGAAPEAAPPVAPEASPRAMPTPDLPPAPAPAPDSGSEEDKVAALFASGNLILIVGSFFLFGLLLSFTPCVFPMIPILSGIIVGQGKDVTRAQGFFLSLSYVLGMALTYTLAGVAAGLSGALLSAALQNPWVLGIFALVFVALSFSMFGFYDLQLPSALQSRFTERANRLKGGTHAGVFVMGALSALIVGPCVAAPLAGALLYIGQSHNVVLGGAALFAMSLGMGVPLLLVGLSAGTLLPRAGAWMGAVKGFFGVLLLGVAVWLVSPVVPPVVPMLAWAALLVVSAVYLHALDPLPPGASGFRKFWKGVGLLLLLGGAALLAGALSGSRDPLQPLAVFRSAGAAPMETPHLAFQRVKDVADLEANLQAARGRPVMLDFYADWCVSCKEMERFTFSDARVQARLKDVVLLQADVTANSEADKALLKRFKLFGPPGIIFFDREGRELPRRVIGYEPPEAFLASLDAALPR